MRADLKNLYEQKLRFQSTIRRAVTLVEVIFSIGVILIGLLGLLSILPLAGRRAQDSLNLNIGSAVSESVLARLKSRQSLSNGELLALDTSVLASPGSPSFVIDPLFASLYEDAANADTSDGITMPPTGTSNGYSELFFPYFKTNHNPFFDPSDTLSTSMANEWPSAQPRLIRAGIARGTPTPPVGAGLTNLFLDAEQARTLVERSDDLPIVRPDDGSKPASYVALQATSTAALNYGKRIPTGEFTWVATVNPLPGGVYASISVVVMRQRERNFVAPAVAGPVGDPRENSIGERLAYVTFASGFSGGAGGLVHLVASASTPSKISANDWIMLSRTDSVNTFHRWYRVVSVDADPIMTTAVDPVSSSSQDVWFHKVLLDGPDWSFGFVTPGNADTVAIADNTFATIVRDVVSVTERTVLLSDL
tara:strand:- start:10503 stop:11768 length:1266 start_codon:yes stop_codon:yes gene_type:complete